QVLELVFVNHILLIGTMEQESRGKLVPAGNARHGSFGFGAAVGALANFQRCELGISIALGSGGSGFTRLFLGEPLDASLHPLTRKRHGISRAIPCGKSLSGDERLGGALALQLFLGFGACAGLPPLDQAIALGY